MAWNHQVLFLCPAGFESAANQLAKAMQHQPGDANTFGRIWYSTSADGSTKDVSIANTRARDQFVAVLTDPSLFPSPPPHGADATQCQTAIAALKAYKPGDAKPDLTKEFVYCIDQDAQTVFKALGLVPYVDPNAPTP